MVVFREVPAMGLASDLDLESFTLRRDLLVAVRAVFLHKLTNSGVEPRN